MDAAVLACTCTAAEAAYVDSYHYRAVRIGRGGAVLEPANGAFNVTVAPGANVQAAVDACPRGGCVLLLPGTHAGPLVLTADQEVHVFGRGLATLSLHAASGDLINSVAATSTIDGLILRYAPKEVFTEEDGVGDAAEHGVRIGGGGLRLQNCDLASASPFACLYVEGPHTDPVIVGCWYVGSRRAVLFSDERRSFLTFLL